MLKKGMSKSILMTALITGNVIWGGTAVYAEEGLQQFNLDQMVVTATRTMKELQEVPSSVSVVTSQDIEERNINSVPEALQTLPGVYMSQAAQGGIQIRGFSSSDILVLLDGLPMNTTFNNGMEWEMVPVENITRIEVVRGAGSSLYGGRAVGAVVNIITKDNPKQKGANVNAVVSYGSNNTWKKALYADARVNKKLSFGVGYENRKSDGYRGYYYTGSASKDSGGIKPDHELPQLSNGKYVLGGRGEKVWENENISANVKYDFDEDKSLKYTFIHTESEYRYKNPWTTIYKDGKPVFSGSVDVGDGKIVKPDISSYLGYDGRKESNLHTLSYNDNKNKFSTNFGYLDMKSNGYSRPKSPTSVDWNGTGSDSFYPGKTYNFDVQKAWEKVGRHSILVGGSFKQESFDQKRKYLTNWHDHNSLDTSLGKNGIYENHEGKARNIALFVQDEYQISDPLTMYLGIRYDYYKKYDGRSRFYDAKSGALKDDAKHDSGSYNEISPKVVFDFKADDQTNYYISYGHSFNPPPFSNIYRYEQNVRANPDLDPETSNTFEIGVKKKLSQRTNLGVSLYQVKTDDKIIYTTHYKPGTTTADYKKYENYGTEKRRGVEFTVDHKFDDNWGTYFNYAWQQGKVKQNAIAGTNLKEVNSADYGIPKHLLHAGVNYNKDKFNAILDCQYVSARQAPDDVTGEYGAEDAYFIVNTAFNYEIAKGTILQFGINNLFDKEFYASEATSGRTYNVSLRYSF